MARVFREVWPVVTAHHSQIPDGVQETEVVGWVIHLRVAYSNLHQENTELKVALAARPALLDTTVLYSAQILER